MLSWLQKLVGCKECPDSSQEIVVLENSLANAIKERNEFSKENLDLEKKVSDMEVKITDLTIALSQTPLAPSEREIYWENKYPKADDVRWTCRYIYNLAGEKEACQVDPRIFWQTNSGELRDIGLSIKALFRLKNKREPSFDELALECLRWVKKNVKYTSDKSVFGVEEYWQFWYETLEIKTGDCEDGAIMLANLMLSVGIPYWRVRLNAGEVKGGGHAYVTYCRETDDEFVTLDWCYWVNDKLPKDRPLHRDERDYYGIWWSWNTKFIFKKQEF